MAERIKYLLRIVSMFLWLVLCFVIGITTCWLSPLVWIFTGKNIYKPLIKFAETHYSDVKLKFPETK